MHLTRLRDGTRRITHITEVQGMEGDVITLQDIFLFDFGMGVDEHGRFKGHLKATGVRPKFAEKLADLGIRLGQEVFQPEGFARKAVGRLMTSHRLHATSQAVVGDLGRRALRHGAARRHGAAPARRPTPALFSPRGRRHRPGHGRRSASSTPAAATPRAPRSPQNGKQVDASAPHAAARQHADGASRSCSTRRAPMDTSGALASAKDAAKQWIAGPQRRRARRRSVRDLLRRRHGRAAPGLHRPTPTAAIAGIDQVAPAERRGRQDKTALWSRDPPGRQRAWPTSSGPAQPGRHGRPGRQRQRRRRVGRQRRGRQRPAAVFAGVYTGAGYHGAGSTSLVDDQRRPARSPPTDGTADGPSSSRTLTGTVDDQPVPHDATTRARSRASRPTSSSTVGDQRTTRSTIAIGSVVTGGQALHPTVRPTIVGRHRRSCRAASACSLAVLLVLVAAAGVAYAITLLFVKDDQPRQRAAALRRGLRPAGRRSTTTGRRLLRQDARSSSGPSSSPSRSPSSQGYLSRAEAALERANLPLRAGEALFFYAAVVVVATILGLVLIGGLIVGLIVGVHRRPAPDRPS